MTSPLERIQPPALLRLQLVTVVVAAACAVAGVLIGMNLIVGRLEDSSNRTASGLVAFRVQDALSQSLEVLRERAQVSTDQLDPEERQVLRDALTGRGPSAHSLDLNLSLSLQEAAALQGTYNALLLEASRLAAESGETRDQTLLQEVESLRSPLERYLTDPTGTNFRSLFLAMTAAGGRAGEAVPDSVTGAQVDDRSLAAAVETAGYVAVAVLVLLSSVVIIVTASASRRVEDLYVATAAEREHLRSTTVDLRHRNDQLNALHSVFTEITDTLSIDYVVNATLREAIRLMDCSAAALRLLRDGQLVRVGSLHKDGERAAGVESRPLTDPLLGRVAKRGKPLRIGEANRDLLSMEHHAAGIQSGLIIPLIVGARVIGTLSVWSYEQDSFTEEDERILMMMGSQVATAIVAADTTDASEHRARHDPLTGLPNRLGLMEDVAKDFTLLQMGERSAVVAMVDIDHFKRFNDDFGHAVGDVSLQKVALTMRQSLRPEDRVYRYGGEEFVVVFMDTNTETGMALAERLRAAVEATPLTGDQLEPVGPVTISMGLAMYPEDGKEVGSLIEMADLAMYRAKALGRNQIATWRRDVVSAAA